MAKLRKAAEIFRVDPEVHKNLGNTFLKQDKLDQAVREYRKALDLKPDNQKINFYLGNIYEKKGQHYNALFQYRKAGANIMVKRVQAKISAQKQSGTGSPADNGHATRATPPPTDLPSQAGKYTRAITAEQVNTLADNLGVSAESLRLLDVGHTGECHCFPERDADGRVVGIVRRLASGKKLSG